MNNIILNCNKNLNTSNPLHHVNFGVLAKWDALGPCHKNIIA